MKVSAKDNNKLLLANKINFALSILLLAIALFGLLRKQFDMGTTILSFILGSILLLNAYLNSKRITAELQGKTISDERSCRIGEKAGSFAFLLLISALIVSALANSILNLRLEYTTTIYVISIFSMFSLIIIGFYVDKKGDV